jgi:LuxR family maltose regulon positive regulatory protein
MVISNGTAMGHLQKADTLIRTKLHLPFTRLELVPRPRLQARITEGLRGPLTLITAPAGFGKTTLVASHIANRGLPVAWLSLDRNDNQVERFLDYLVTALQQADDTIGSEAAQLLAAALQAPPEAVLISLINDLDTADGEIVLVLDDYQFISSQAVHEQVIFLLEHCPKTFHLVIATRSDPPLPLTRLRVRGQMVELRAADLRFSEAEAAQFLNEVMGLGLDAGSVAVLEERTEGWVAGLQMAALALQGTLSMRDREDVAGFIEGFSGTNRYIMDYLLEEVLASQPPEIQRFLLYTSILERLTAPLCDAVLAGGEGAKREGDDRSTGSESLFLGESASILEYLERANLFLMPLDDERTWYRYHHLFAELLRAQLQRSLGAEGVAQLHVRASDWHGQNGSILKAIHHASMASDEERVERFIEQHYMELVSRGEQSWLRSWTGKLSKELVYNRPWLCIYEAYSHSWFGELDEADRLLEEAEKRIRSEISAPDARSMQGLLAYVKSRATAMRGDIQRAIEFCLKAREYTPASNLALQLDTRITLGYEYFMADDYANASLILNETIRSGITAGAVINTVAASCVLARLVAVQGLLHKSYDTYQVAAQSIPEASGQHLGARGLVEVGIADVLCEWNDLDAALAHIEQGLALLPFWDKADDWILAYVTLARIHLAQANRSDATEAVEKAIQLIQTRGVFPEARHAAEIAQVKLWLAQGDLQAASRWLASHEERLSSDDRFRFENELARITLARVYMAQKRLDEAIGLLSHLEETARSAGRMGRVIEILLLQALAMREMGDSEHALLALTKCLTLAEPEGYVRVFLDEGQPVQMLLAQWLAHAGASPLQDYAVRLFSQFDAESHMVTAAQGRASPTGDPSASSGQALIEPLSQRELEVLHLMALGRTNKEIARQLIVAPGTVKAHTASIYRKLDVANRTEATARARQLGILP